jgi:hypothetical protein
MVRFGLPDNLMIVVSEATRPVMPESWMAGAGADSALCAADAYGAAGPC